MTQPSDSRAVGNRIAAALPQVVFVLAACLLASATIGFAAEVRVKPQHHHAAQAKRHVLVVPDVRDQVFVFAKGMLEDGGFGWKVDGGVRGFAANRVVSQSPAPGTLVFDTGSPEVTVELRRDTTYAQHGAPEDLSPYGHTRIMRVHHARAVKVTKHVNAHTGRTPAFVVPGAPSEPTGEPSLPTQARRLAAYINHHPAATNTRVHHWLSANAWIVTGASFGWWGGAQALRTLIRADKRAEHLWGVGSASRKSAEQTLRVVAAKSR